MGFKNFVSKVFTKKQNDRSFMTDDERELREYEENEYKPESKLADNAYAEFIVGDCYPVKTTAGEITGVKVTGTVTVGTLCTGDRVQIEASLKENTLRSQIAMMEQYRKVITSASEGAFAAIVLNGIYPKQIKRNAIVKKLTGTEPEQ